MKKLYLVKKNPGLPAADDNWIVMNGFEFAMFLKTPEGQSRTSYFARLDACSENDTIIIAECDIEQVRAIRAERDRHDYLYQQEIESGIFTVSLDDVVPDSDETIAEFIPDDCNIEEEVAEKLLTEALFQAVASLSDQDRSIIEALYCDDPMSEKEYAQKMSLAQSTVHFRKLRALSKLKKILLGKKF